MYNNVIRKINTVLKFRKTLNTLLDTQDYKYNISITKVPRSKNLGDTNSEE